MQCILLKDILAGNPKVKFYPLGAGSTKGFFKFTISDRDDSSTFLPSEKEANEMGLKQIDVEVVALNEFIKEHKLPVPEIIKIDAEGLDLEVLKGASEYFGKTEIFMVEAAVVSKYIKNDIAVVITYMKENGYKLFDITDLNRPFHPRVLWLVELVFIRENGFIDSQNVTPFPSTKNK
jgi:FkbM family methyltransferase